MNPRRGHVLWIVIAASALLVLGLLAFALVGVFFGPRPIGDGRNIESYGFDLTNLRVPREALVASGRPRDVLLALDNPRSIAGKEIEEFNRARGGRNKYLVSTDRVVGLTIGGQSRAWPVRLLNAHEIIHDELGGIPLAITWSPFCDSAMVFDRRADCGVDAKGPLLSFGVSGLLLNGNLVMYDKGTNAGAGAGAVAVAGAGATHAPSLWSQLASKAVSGPAAARGAQLCSLAGVVVCPWGQWLTAHPDTSVALPDEESLRRIKAFSYERYLDSPELEWPVVPLAGGRAAAPGDPADKQSVVVTRTGPDSWSANALTSRGAHLELPIAPEGTKTIQCLWFAWRAFHGADTTLVPAN